MRLTTLQKAAITVVLALLCVWLLGCSSTKSVDAHNIEDVKPTIEKLQAYYDQTNNTFFHGRLPGTRTKIVFADLSHLPKPEFSEIEESTSGQWVLRIDPQFHAVEQQAELSVSHEMCHQAARINNWATGIDGHSYAFQNCMVGQAEQGVFTNIW